MPTIIETLTQLGQDVRDAIVAFRGAYADLVSIKNTTISSTQSIINNFLKLAPVKGIFVDPTSGDDVNGDGTQVKPFKTIDRAMLEVQSYGFNDILCNGDVQLNKFWNVYSALQISGVSFTNDPAIPATSQPRQLTFRGEATNSPNQFLGRLSAGFKSPDAPITFRNMNVMLGDPAAVLSHPFHVSTLGEVRLQSSNIDAPTAGGSSRFLGTDLHAFLYMTGSISNNAKGRVFNGVASGANPNNAYYTSNLNSA